MNVLPNAQRLSSTVIGYNGVLWTRCAARKAGVCWLTGQAFARGALVYRPLTNQSSRMRRIEAGFIDAKVLA